MDFIIELIGELILEGSWEAASSRKVPMILRILAGVILIVVYGALVMLGGILAWNGIQKSDPTMVLIGSFLLVLVTVGGICAYKKLQRQNEDDAG